MQSSKRQRLIYGVLLLCAWTGAAFLFIRTSGNLTVAEFLKYEPENKLAAALIMLGLFALKSVDFLLHSGVLYAVSGIIFPPATAMAVNLLGAFGMAAIPWHIGKALGGPAAERTWRRYPKLRGLKQLHTKHEFLFVLLVRVIGIPVAAAGSYMGAVKIDRRRYASILGMLPTLLCFTFMGDSASDPASPKFWIAMAVYLTVSLLALAASAYIGRREKGGNEKNKANRREENEQTMG